MIKVNCRLLKSVLYSHGATNITRQGVTYCVLRSFKSSQSATGKSVKSAERQNVS